MPKLNANKSQEITIIGDLNAKVAKKKDGEIVGKFQLRIYNKCREKSV